MAKGTNAAGCIWTATHCACSKRSAVTGNNQCFDFVSAISGSENVQCTSRDCADSYVCDCDGESYCGFKNETKEVLVTLTDSTCKYESKAITSVHLVNENINNITPSGVANAECIFSDDKCTCASSMELGITNDCVDFKYEDPLRGSICSIRDCNLSFHCDCGGTHTCTKRMYSKTAWQATGQEGTPGLVLCDQLTMPAIDVQIIP